MMIERITDKNSNERRVVWKALRASLELSHYKYKRSGRKSRSHWNFFEKLLYLFECFLKLGDLYEKGIRNASQVSVVRKTLKFSNLPTAFDGFTILHLTDLHIDSIAGHEKQILKAVENLSYDVALFTGDYRKNISGAFSQILTPMKTLSAAMNPPYGKWAVLGNHDTYLMADYEEDIGIRLLVNESVKFQKDGQEIVITGTDDPFYYYSEQAMMALERPIEGFKIALVHTSELRDIAADNDYKLYLCGHTHGGQICLPNGKALLSHQYEGKETIAGLWYHQGMTGYTSRGCGVSGLPVRYNCPPEVTLFRLEKQKS
jgi:hypothetical protein